MLDDVARGLPADAGADPDGPVLQLHLHEHRAQCVDPPARARGPVLLIDRHRIGDRAVHDPMALLLIVVVRARLAWLNHAGTDLTDPSRPHGAAADRKSTRLNSSHSQISYAVFCLKKKNKLHYYSIPPTDLSVHNY